MRVQGLQQPTYIHFFNGSKPICESKFLKDHSKMPTTGTIPPAPTIQFYSIMFSQKIHLHFLVGHAKLVMDMLNIP